MNREIKFRAWHESEKKMIYPDCKFHFIADGKLFKLDPHIEVNRYFIMPIEIEVNQYVGLKDRNGKDIYEGDIVKSTAWNPETYKVIYEDGSFGFKNEEGDYLNSLHYLEKFEVIGNIYENSDLYTPSIKQ